MNIHHYSPPLRWIIVKYLSVHVCMLWLLNLAGCTLLHSPLKIKVVFVAKSISWFITKIMFLTYMASESLNLSFTLNCVLKHALLKLKNNFKLTCWFCFQHASEIWSHSSCQQKSLPNSVRHTVEILYNKYLTNLIFLVCTVPCFFPYDLWLAHFTLGP